MSSWVRYCIAVYLGLLLAGTLIPPNTAESAGPPPRREHTQRHATVDHGLPADRNAAAPDDPRVHRHTCDRCGEACTP